MNIKTVVSVATFGLVAGCVLSACNEDEFVTAEVPTISSADDLGDCGKKNRGQIVVVEDDGIAYECSNGDWVKLDDDEEVSSSSVLTFPSSSSKKEEKVSSSSGKPEESSSSIATNSSSSRNDSEAESSSRNDSEEDADSSSSEESEESSSSIATSSSSSRDDSEEPAVSSSSEIRLACGEETYDPTTEDCINDIPVNSDYVKLCGPEEIKYSTLTSLCARDGEVYSRDAGYNLCIYENESGDAYLPSKSFCNGLDAIPLCNGLEFNVATQECLNNKVVDSENVATCGLQGVKYDKTAQFCSSYSVYDLCDGKTYTPRNGNCENGTYYYSNSSGTYIQDLRDKKTYKYVKIGNAYWMAKNLNYYDENSTQIKNNSICAKSGDEEQASCEKEGRLYDWETAVAGTIEDPLNHQGICPEGWRIPSYNDFMAAKQALLEIYESDAAAVYAAQATGYKSWTHATNNSGLGFQHTPLYNTTDDTYSPSDYAYYTTTTTNASYVAAAAVGPSEFGGAQTKMWLSKTGTLVPIRCIKDSK